MEVTQEQINLLKSEAKKRESKKKAAKKRIENLQQYLKEFTYCKEGNNLYYIDKIKIIKRNIFMELDKLQIDILTI